MEALERLKSKLAEFERTEHESLAIDLRTQFAAIISTTLSDLGWTQSRLATAAGIHESRVSKLIHGDENCTIGTMARVLFALGVGANIKRADLPATEFVGAYIVSTGETHGEEDCEKGVKEQGTTEVDFRYTIHRRPRRASTND